MQTELLLEAQRDEYDFRRFESMMSTTERRAYSMALQLT